MNFEKRDKMTEFTVRLIRETDNKTVEAIIRSCLIEFGGDHEGTAWTDPNLGSFFQLYSEDKCAYWVAEVDGEVVGGVGVGKIADIADICELQKMYCLPAARGTQISHTLMRTALDFAKKYYKGIYLETLDNMTAAQKFYEKYGFRRLDKPIGNTGHFSCNVCYLREL